MTNKNAVSFLFLICIMLLLETSLKAQSYNTTDLSPIGSEAFEVMRQFFDYDQAVPLEARIVDRIETQGHVREKIVFRGVNKSLVSGYLAIPKKGTAPYPVVLLIHGLNSSKESWWEENSTMRELTDQLLESGFSVLSLDAQHHGERARNSDFESPTDILEKEWFIHFRDMIIQSTIEYRRGMDYLNTRPEIDPSQIGVVGYSMGGMMTFILSAVDPRVKASVASVSPIITVPYLPTAVHHYASYIKEKSFLMLMANNDVRNYTKETANQLYNLIGSDAKDLIFFDSGHMLPAEWTNHATEWLVEYLIK